MIPRIKPIADADPRLNIPRPAKALLAVASVAWLLTGVHLLAGCAPASRTRVDGAATEATHRVEAPGVTRTRTREVEILPAPLRPAAPATSPGGGASQSSATHPASPDGRDRPATRPTHHRAESSGRAGLVAVSWPGGDRPESDPLAEAVREAARSGGTVTYRESESETVPLAATESTLSDRGASLNTSSDEAAIGWEGRGGGARLPWGGNTGKRTTGLTADLASAATNPLVWIGGLVCVGAIVPLVLPPRRWGTAAAVFGVGAAIATLGIVATSSPWIFGLAVLLALAVAVWFGYQAWRNGRAQVALRSVAKGVETLPKELGELVKDRVKDAAPEAAKQAVKSEISAQKTRIGQVKKQPVKAGD